MIHDPHKHVSVYYRCAMKLFLNSCNLLCYENNVNKKVSSILDLSIPTNVEPFVKDLMSNFVYFANINKTNGNKTHFDTLFIDAQN